MFRVIKWLLILALVGGGLVALAIPMRTWWAERTKPKYLTAAVTRGSVEAVVNSTGTVKPVRSVSVGAFTSGPLADVFVDFNSVVEQGELLAKIDPRLLSATVERDRATLETQKADLARTEAQLQQAINNEERARKLRAINVDYLSDQEMDQFHFARMSAEAQRNLARAAIKQAEAALKNSEANLGFTNIISPVAGIIIERKVDPGQTVVSSFQTAELFIVAPDMEKHMHVFASVDEADIGQIRAAQERSRNAKFTVDAYPDDLFEGRIYQIRRSATTTQNVVTYPVVIEAPNPDLKLLPGMTANISFQIDVRDDVLRVPAAALRFVPLPAQVHPDDRHYVEGIATTTPEEGTQTPASEKVEQARNRQRRLVWVQKDEWLRAVPVTLGLIEGKYAELVKGDLEEGDEVVTGTESPFAGR